MMARTHMVGRTAALVSLVLLAAASAVAQTSADINTYNRYIRQGMQELQASDYPAAKDAFREALRLYDGGSAGHMGLGLALFHLREDADAERELTRAASLDPKLSEAYLWLGELSYRRDDLPSAVGFWERAVAIDPGSKMARARLDRVRKEHQAEKEFSRDVTSHFVVKYEGRERIETGRIVLRILEDAYGEIGRGLSTYPDRDVQVILYSSQQFQEVTDAPGWSGGLYDGKIRIPIGGIDGETPGLRRLLYHEYAHAVVRTITPRCPTWLNEGLAQYFEGRGIDPTMQKMLQRMAEGSKLPTLARLEGPFTGLGSDQAMVAYLVSLSATRYLVDTHGMYRVKSILDELGAGADMALAVERTLSLSYEALDRGWNRSLE